MGWISDEEQSYGAFSLFSGREANRTGGLGVTPLPHDSRRRLFQTNAVAAAAAARTDNRRVNAAPFVRPRPRPSVCVRVGIRRASRSRPRDENLVRENSSGEGRKEGRREGAINN